MNVVEKKEKWESELEKILKLYFQIWNLILLNLFISMILLCPCLWGLKEKFVSGYYKAIILLRERMMCHNHFLSKNWSHNPSIIDQFLLKALLRGGRLQSERDLNYTCLSFPSSQTLLHVTWPIYSYINLQFLIPSNDDSTVVPQFMSNYLAHMKFHMLWSRSTRNCWHSKVSIFLLKFKNFFSWAFTIFILQKINHRSSPVDNHVMPFIPIQNIATTE